MQRVLLHTAHPIAAASAPPYVTVIARPRKLTLAERVGRPKRDATLMRDRQLRASRVESQRCCRSGQHHAGGVGPKPMNPAAACIGSATRLAGSHAVDPCAGLVRDEFARAIEAQMDETAVIANREESARRVGGKGQARALMRAEARERRRWCLRLHELDAAALAWFESRAAVPDPGGERKRAGAEGESSRLPRRVPHHVDDGRIGYPTRP